MTTLLRNGLTAADVFRRIEIAVEPADLGAQMVLPEEQIDEPHVVRSYRVRNPNTGDTCRLTLSLWQPFHPQDPHDAALAVSLKLGAEYLCWEWEVPATLNIERRYLHDAGGVFREAAAMLGARLDLDDLYRWGQSDPALQLDCVVA